MLTPMTDTEAVLAELRELRERIEAGRANVDDAYARRLELFQEARSADPPVPHRVLAEASRVTEVAIINALAKQRSKERRPA